VATDKVVQGSGHEEITAPSILETGTQLATSSQTGTNTNGLALAPAAASPDGSPVATDKVVQGSGHEEITAPSILETGTELATLSQTAANVDGLTLAPATASLGTTPAVTTVKAPQRIAAPTEEPEDTVPSNADALARDSEPTTNLGMAGFLRLTPKMFLLALGLAVLVTLSSIVIKIAAARSRERQEHHLPISNARDNGLSQLSRVADDERSDNARYNCAVKEDDKYARLIQELVMSICRS
jgi:hypothetical protein